MPTSLSESLEYRTVRHWSDTALQPALTTLVYRSRTTHDMSDADLDRLLDSARRRNRAASVTGLLIYHEGRFLQWLEGPAERVARIWNGIRHDPRHTDIEVLSDAPATARLFPGWDMKLGMTDLHGDGKASEGKILITANLIAALRPQPECALALLAFLGPSGVQLLDGRRPLALDDDLALREMVEETVVARLTSKILPARLLPDALLDADDPRLAQLARLLVASDPADALELFDHLQAAAGSLRVACATVTEPVARGLGDLWATDDCSEFDVSLGLARLQQAFRRQQIAIAPLRLCRDPVRVVLVAPQPGEPHLLSAMLDAELLWRAGWDTHCEFPADDTALQDLVSGTWFDAIDLSLSTSFGRSHWAPRMAASIAAARSASLNPAMTVVVGGRLFYEMQGNASRLAGELGANAANTTSAGVVRLLQSEVVAQALLLTSSS